MILSIVNSNLDQLQDDSWLLNIRKAISALTNAIICKMEFGRKISYEYVTGGFDSLIREILLLAGSINIGDHIPYLALIDHL